MPRPRLVPLTPTIAYRSTILPQPFHDDPAGQKITVVTAREENATIVSKDGLIRDYRHVRAGW